MLTGNALTRYSASVAVVERARAEEQRQRRVDRGRRPVVPRHADRACRQRAARGRAAPTASAPGSSRAGIVRTAVAGSPGSSVTRFSTRCDVGRRDVGPGPADQVQHVGVGRRVRRPRAGSAGKAAFPRRTGDRCSTRCRSTSAHTPASANVSNGIGTQIRSAPSVVDHVHASGGGNVPAGSNTDPVDRDGRVGGAAFLDDVVGAVDLVMPGAAVPVVGRGRSTGRRGPCTSSVTLKSGRSA